MSMYPYGPGWQQPLQYLYDPQAQQLGPPSHGTGQAIDVPDDIHFQNGAGLPFPGMSADSASLTASSAQQIPAAGSRFAGYNFGAGAGAGAGAAPAYTIGGQAANPAWYSNPRLWGAAVGGIGSYLDQRAQNQAAGGSGNTNMTSTSEPWGPSTNYRDIAMQQALGLLQGQGQGGGGGRGRGGRRGGGGGGGRGGGGFGNSQQLANAMSGYAMGSDPLVEQGRGFISDALNDPYGGSELLGRTFERASTFGDDELDSFISNMMNDWGQSGGGGGGTRNNPFGGGGGFSRGGGTAGPAHGLIGMDRYIREMLDSEYGARGQNPEMDALIAQGNAGATDAYQQGLAGLSAMGAADGAGTSSAYQLADATAAGNFGRALAENETGVRYQDFERYRDEIMQAMGLGTQYDLGMAGIDAQNRATSASSRSSGQALALQRELGNRGLLMDAFGLRQGYNGAGLDTMAGLSNIDVANRQFMLGAIPQYHNIPMDDMERAFGTNFGLDSRRAQMSAEAAARQQANSRYQANLPWQRLAQYMDIINGASGGYGTQREFGTQPTGQQQGGSEWGQALMGLLGGAQLAGNLYSSYRGS